MVVGNGEQIETIFDENETPPPMPNEVFDALNGARPAFDAGCPVAKATLDALLEPVELAAPGISVAASGPDGKREATAPIGLLELIALVVEAEDMVPSGEAGLEIEEGEAKVEEIPDDESPLGAELVTPKENKPLLDNLNDGCGSEGIVEFVARVRLVELADEPFAAFEDAAVNG